MAEPAAWADYKLRAELLGHQEDVRDVIDSDLGVLTSSRDKTIKIWAEEAGGGFQLLHTLVGHTGYVGPLAFIPAGVRPDLPNGAVVSGSFDATVRVWDPATATELAVLKGHEYQVTALAVLPGGDIASASVDKTIRIWRGAECAATLEGHEGPVLSLAVTPEGDLLSGSGDCTIKRWAGVKCVQTYKGHTDTVRALCLLPGVGFVSGSHDQTLRVWALSGETLAELVGHAALVYGVAATPGGLIASGSEDNTARLWRMSGDCLQSIDHPGCVWAVAFLKGGDLATACADAAARVWTPLPERQDVEASASFMKRLKEVKAAKAAAAAEGGGGGGGGEGAAGGHPALPPGIKVDDALVLTNPGKKDGETKIVREADGSVWAYGWNGAKKEWDRIGEVVAAPEAGTISGGAKTHAGRTWDCVFDVELDSGDKLKLAMDEHENPYIVADRFLAEYELPAEFKEQIVAFIIQNTGGGKGPKPAADLPITGGFCDPFTGGGGGSSMPPPPRPPPPPVDLSVTGGGADPFTGSSGAPAPAQAAAAAGGALQIGGLSLAYLLFDAPPPADALFKKLREFSGQLAGDGEMADVALTAEEEAPGGPLEALLQRLPAAAAGAAAPLSAPDRSLLSRLLQWPAAQLFPALDVARCLVLDAAASDALSSEASLGSMREPRLGTLAYALAAAAVGDAAPARQTALRLAANCFKRPALRAWALSERELILDGFAGCHRPESGGSKGVRLGYATLLLNYSVAARAEPAVPLALDAEGKMQVLSCLEDLLAVLPADEADAAHRALAAVAALASGDAELAAVARDLGLGQAAARLGAGGGKVAAAAAEVQRVLG